MMGMFSGRKFDGEVNQRVKLRRGTFIITVGELIKNVVDAKQQMNCLNYLPN